MSNSAGVALISSSGFPVTIQFSVYFQSTLQPLTWQKQINQSKLNNVNRGELYLKIMRADYKNKF